MLPGYLQGLICGMIEPQNIIVYEPPKKYGGYTVVDNSDYSGLTPDEKTFGMLTHLSALLFLILPSFGNVIGPLVVWLLKKDQSEWIDRQGKESLNFQISITIYAILSGILVIVLIGFLLLPLLFIFWLIFVIIASVKVSNGEEFHYPLAIRFFN
jgi:hypothetical protein